MNTFGQGPTRWSPVRDTTAGDDRPRGSRRAAKPDRPGEPGRRASAEHDEPSRDFVRQAMNDHYR